MSNYMWVVKNGSRYRDSNYLLTKNIKKSFLYDNKFDAVCQLNKEDGEEVVKVKVIIKEVKKYKKPAMENEKG